MFGRLLALVAVVMTAPASAQELKVGLGAMARSMDLHFYNSGPDVANMLHVFDKLVLQDEKQGLIPGLATSWTSIDPTTWEVKLREGVTFHDGSPFTAEDVAFTVKRAVDVPKSGSPFSLYVNTIKEVVIKGPHLVHLITAAPAPLLPWDISTFGIISKKLLAESGNPKGFQLTTLRGTIAWSPRTDEFTLAMSARPK